MGQFMTTQRGGEGTKVGAGGDDLPWWFKHLGRGFGILGGSLAVLFGALNCISVTPKCIASGLVLIVAGLIGLVLEAPCCFVFFDFGDKLARWSEERKPWHKVVLFVVLSIPAVAIYQGVFTILGSAFLFLTGVAYGLMNLGKKASREEMAEKARELDRDMDKLKLVFAEKKPATNDNNKHTPQEFTGDVNLETPSTVVSMNPASPNNAIPAPAALAAPNRGMGYSPLQNEFSTEPNAPVVMSPVNFDSPGPSPAHVPPVSTSREFEFAEPRASYSFGADVEQPFADPQPQSTPVLPPPPAQQQRRQGVGGGSGGFSNLINF